MKITSMVVLLILLSSGAMAGLDPDPDQMGVYFDPAGETVCINAAFSTTVEAYLLYTHPTLATVRGFEGRITLNGDDPVQSILTHTYLVDGVDIGVKDQTGGIYNFISAFTAPLPTSPATILCTLQLLYLDTGPVDLVLGPTDPASLGTVLPVVMREDFSLMPVGMSAPIGPTAAVNAPHCWVVPNTDSLWDAIKAMYR